MWSFREIISVHEYVLASRVAVQVTHQYDFTLPVELANELFDCRVDRMQNLRWVLPAPIQVLATQ